jgi:protein TonB
MIDMLPSPRSAIFTSTTARKLPHSFYWGAGIALLLHAGLVYYLVRQNFSHALVDDPPVTDRPMIVTVDTPRPPPPTPQATQKPVRHVMVHTPLDPVTTTTETPPLTLNNVTTIADGPPVVEPPVMGGAGARADPGPVYVTPRWKAFPDAAALTDYYPPRALDNEMEGSASVQCTVLDAAGRVHCTVVSETPKGYGFGQQTVKMVEERGRVDTSAGNIRIGSVLSTTTVKWQLN